MDALYDVLYVCIARGCKWFRMLSTWMPLWIQMWFYGFMYMDANVDAMQSFWVFIYFDEMLCRMEVLYGVIDMPI